MLQILKKPYARGFPPCLSGRQLRITVQRTPIYVRWGDLPLLIFCLSLVKIKWGKYCVSQYGFEKTKKVREGFN